MTKEALWWWSGQWWSWKTNLVKLLVLQYSSLCRHTIHCSYTKCFKGKKIPNVLVHLQPLQQITYTPHTHHLSPSAPVLLYWLIHLIISALFLHLFSLFYSLFRKPRRVLSLHRKALVLWQQCRVPISRQKALTGFWILSWNEEIQ